ncbi:hypothetical protein CVT24_012910 [Panaeolus cyanescens]|uniref:Uncharacterized protein n=1 Tax=Panaeolus cyanescens TaxID=181874 RepID=A0A409X4M5_9AGAR|nr:hypothetical protein CVT24_012910 [Panaeolus cyanescens]
MGRAHHPTSSRRVSPVMSKASSSSSSSTMTRNPIGMAMGMSSSASMPMSMSTSTAMPMPTLPSASMRYQHQTPEFIDLTDSPPLPSSSVSASYGIAGEPSSSHPQRRMITNAPPNNITFHRVASSSALMTAPASTPAAPPPYASAPATPAPTISPTSVVASGFPFGFSTWNTASSQPNQHAQSHQQNPSQHQQQHAQQQQQQQPHPQSNSQQQPQPQHQQHSQQPIPRPIRHMPKGCTERMLDLTTYPCTPGFTLFYGPDSPIAFRYAGGKGGGGSGGNVNGLGGGSGGGMNGGGGGGGGGVNGGGGGGGMNGTGGGGVNGGGNGGSGGNGVNGGGGGGGGEGHLTGISMRDALSGTGNIEDAHATVFNERRGMGKTSFVFVLRWPGYSNMNFRAEIPIVKGGGEGITRMELANAIAVQYRNFCTVSLLPSSSSPSIRLISPLLS